MSPDSIIRISAAKALKDLYGLDVEPSTIIPQATKKEFEGDMTLVVFPWVKAARKAPDAVAKEIGDYLVDNEPAVSRYNVIKGFLNLVIDPTFWNSVLRGIARQEDYGFAKADENSPLVMVEYSSPNTNKPLHLGHLRNILLGYSLASILKACGNRVVKTNIVNDRGIHICKSMLAWQKWGDGATPESTGKKGDHLIGDFYVLFDKHYKAEVKELMAKGMTQEEAEAASPLMLEAREMLRKWEQKDPEVRSLWEMMNRWVYAGFDETYERMGVDFDKIYYESNTYLEGKEKVLEGLEKGIMYRYQDYPIDKMIYVVGNEQNYHFQVLSLLLDKLGFKWGKDLVHFSYGMVELPEGKMKSREGTVVDADDLMDEMVNTARSVSAELGKLDGCTPEEIDEITETVGLGALKYFLLKVDPRKNMTFNPKESIDFNGNTGPFIQYTYARIRSVLRKADEAGMRGADFTAVVPGEREVTLIRRLADFPSVVREAGRSYSPALIANYIYDLVKEYNQFYHDCSILKEEDAATRSMRLELSAVTADVIRRGMGLLGIKVPERM